MSWCSLLLATLVFVTGQLLPGIADVLFHDGGGAVGVAREQPLDDGPVLAVGVPHPVAQGYQGQWRDAGRQRPEHADEATSPARLAGRGVEPGVAVDVDLGGVKGEGDHGVAAEFITLDEVLGLSRFSTSRIGRRLTPVSAANSPRTRRRPAGIWPLRMYRRGSSKSFSPNRSRLISFMASGA